MKIAMVISQTNPEVVFTAFRLANFSRKEGDDVKVFILAERVELDRIDVPKFHVRGRAKSFLGAGGCILAGRLKLRNSGRSCSVHHDDPTRWSGRPTAS